jgi:hypothetical protein
VHRRSFLLLLILPFLLYSLGLSLFSMDGFPANFESGKFMPYLSDKPVGEDGYYMLTVAWKIASGEGIVYNGGLPTTGIQPLSTFVYAALAWLVRLLGGDPAGFVRLTILFNALNLVLFAHLVGKLSCRLSRDAEPASTAYLLGFVLALFNFGLFRAFTYGLETGLYLTLLAACILFTLRVPPGERPTWRQALGFGALAGLSGLARLDFGIILLLFLGLSWLRKQFSFGAVLLAGLAALVVVSPWFLYVHAVTGNWMPSSGGAQSALITAANTPLRLRMMAEAILGHLTPWMYLNGGIMAVPALLSLAAGAGVLFSARAVRQKMRSAFSDPNRVFTIWGLAIVPLIAVYLIFFWATHFYDRYTAPLLVITLPVIACLLSAWLQGQARRLAWAAMGGLVLMFFAWSYASLHTGRIGNSHSVTAGYIQQYFPTPAKVGVFQSGVIGFYNPNVINLDGKVNQAALDAAAEGRMEEYLDASGIQVLIDWPQYIQRAIATGYLDIYWQPCEHEIPGGASVCYQRTITP